MRVTAEIGRDADHLREVRFLVDTGAFYAALPARLASELGLEPTMTSRIQVADGRAMTIGLCLAYFRLMGREAGLAVAVIETPEPLLGVTVLEALGLKVNPVKQTLEYDSPLIAPPMMPLLRGQTDA